MPDNSIRFVVTGASGFVGFAVAKTLMQRGYEVVGLSRKAFEAPFPVKVVDSLERQETIEQVFEAASVVVHCAARVHVMNESAWESETEFRRVNRDLTLMLAKTAAAAGISRFLFLSSVKVNGEETPPRSPFTEVDEPDPQDAYAYSKLEAEIALQSLSESSGLETVIIRAPLVYGPGVKGNFERLLAISDSSLPLPFGALNNKRGMVFIGNLVDFVIHAATHPRADNKVFLVSDGEDVSTGRLVSEIRRALGRPARLFPMPAWVLTGIGRLSGKADMVRRLIGSLEIDIAKARKELGWTPAYSLRQGIEMTVDAINRKN